MNCKNLFGLALLISIFLYTLALRPTLAASPPGPITPAQLLALHEEAQCKLYHSFIARFEANHESYLNQHPTLEPGHRKGRVVVEVRTDGKRHYWSKALSGQCYPRLSQTTPATDPRIHWFLSDGHSCYTAGHEPLWLINQVVQKMKPADRLKALRSRLNVRISEQIDPISEFSIHYNFKDVNDTLYAPGGIGTGGLMHKSDLIPKLKKARTISVEPRQELVSGASCYVLKANLVEILTASDDLTTTNEYAYRIHLSPTHDYHIARLEKTLNMHRVLKDKSTQSTRMHSLVDQVQFQKLDGSWIPMEWQVTMQDSTYDRQYFQSSKSKVKRTRLLLNPDHNSLGSFTPSFIKDGWSVRLDGFGGKFNSKTNLIWKAGKVVDEAGHVIF